MSNRNSSRLHPKHFAWQSQDFESLEPPFYAGYRFAKLFQTTLGYCIIGTVYDKGTGEERFRYDMNTFRPNIRFGFNL